MKRTVSILLICIAFAAPLFAGGGGESDKGVAFDPNRQYTVSIGCYGDLAAAYKTVFSTPAFKRAYPNITVEYQTSDFNGHHNRLTTVLAAGESTNEIEAIELVYIASFVDGGRLTSFSNEMFAGDAAVEHINPAAVAMATSSKRGLVAMPVDIGPVVLFYREDLLRASGVDPSEIEQLSSWEELIEIGKRVTRDTDGDGTIDQYALPNAAEAALMMIGGGKTGWFSEDGKPLEPADKYIHALELARQIRDAGIDADTSVHSGLGISALSDEGEFTVAMVPAMTAFGGGLKLSSAVDVKGWRVASLPGSESALGGGTFLTIPENVPAEQKAAAWEVVKYLSGSAEAQRMIYTQIYAFPVQTELYADPAMRRGDDYFGGQDVWSVYTDAANMIPTYAVNENDPIADGIWGNSVGEVLINDLDPEDAWQQAVNQILAIID